VVTFHGMRPWDNSKPQVREWEQEADRYGFIVVAPDLRTSDTFMQYPLRDPDQPYVRRDEQATLAIRGGGFRPAERCPTGVAGPPPRPTGVLRRNGAATGPPAPAVIGWGTPMVSSAMAVLNPALLPAPIVSSAENTLAATHSAAPVAFISTPSEIAAA